VGRKHHRIDSQTLRISLGDTGEMILRWPSLNSEPPRCAVVGRSGAYGRASTTSPSWEANLNPVLSVHFPGSFHIEIGDRYLPCSLLREHPEGFPDNRVVPDLTAMTVTKDQNYGRALFNHPRRLWRNLSSLCP